MHLHQNGHNSHLTIEATNEVKARVSWLSGLVYRGILSRYYVTAGILQDYTSLT